MPDHTGRSGLLGKRALVMDASRGIGAEIATPLADAGADVGSDESCWELSKSFGVVDFPRVRVHGSRVTSVQIKTRCRSAEPGRAAIGPEASAEPGVSDPSRQNASKLSGELVGGMSSDQFESGRPDYLSA
jgi:NAD(P)-dependent dehydrogenase (short-subunit alcohol dehydrogenase family)